VAADCDLRGQLRPALDLLSDHEEGRSHSGAPEQLEHRGGTFRVGPVVEGERYASVDGSEDAEAVRSPRDDRGQEVAQHAGMIVARVALDVVRSALGR
jgi:hypothetical protein